VSGRRWVPLGLGVTALLVVAGIASHGRPLAGGRGSGPTATFFDYVATTLAIAAFVMLGVFVYVALSHRWSSGGPPRRTRSHLLSTLLLFAGAAVIAWLILNTGFEQRLRRLEQQLGKHPPGQAQRPLPRVPKDTRNARLRWDEIAIVVALLGGAALVVLATRGAKKTPRTWRLGREDALAFYKRFYAPNNAILVIAGDVDAKEIRPMVEKYYSEIPAQPAIPEKRMRPQEPVPAAPRPSNELAELRAKLESLEARADERKSA